jgi:hypothetical protein
MPYLIVHSLTQFAGSTARKVTAHQHILDSSEDTVGDRGVSHELSSNENSPEEDKFHRYGNGDTEESQGYVSDELSDLGSDHPDYALVQSARLHAQKSQQQKSIYIFTILTSIQRNPTKKACPII